MSVRAVVVAHRETLAAEGIAAALGAVPRARAGRRRDQRAEETERCAEQADAVAIDARIPGAVATVGRLRKRGLRVVVIGEATPGDDGEGGSRRRASTRRWPTSRRRWRPARNRWAPGRTDLSNREEQVLRLAAKGMAGKQIARSLGISPKTVEQHKTRAFKRLGVPNQVAAVADADREGEGERGAHPLPESPSSSLVGDRGVGRRRERALRG